MRAQSKIWISITASLVVAAVIAYFAFIIVRGMSKDFAQYQRYSEIINEAFDLNILIDAALKEGSNARRIQQIGQVSRTLNKALESISSSNSREESLLRQIRRNNLELGPLLEQLFDQKEGSGGSIALERRTLLASQLMVKVRFITDDVNRLMETSGTRIVSAQAKTSLIVLILIVVVILTKSIIYFFSSRSIVKAQEALQESQRQAALLADLLESSSQPFGTGFPDGHMGMCNPAFPRLLGYSKEEFFALDWGKDLTPPEWLEKEAAILAELHRTGQPVRYEKEYWHKDGTRVPVELLVHLRRDEQGEPSYYYAFVTDITERQRAEEEIKRLASFPQMNPTPVLELDATGAISFYNQAAIEALGTNGSEAGLACLLPADIGEIATAARQKHEQVFYREVKLEDTVFGQTISYAESFDVLRIYSMDITKRKRAEEALRESEERLRLFIEHAPASLAMFNNEMGYLSVSRRWLSDYGLGDRDLLGLSHYEVFPEIPARWREIHRRGLAGEVIRSEADRLERADGSVLWLRWEVWPWHDASGRVGGIVIFTEDITERQRAEEALRQSEERYRTLFNTLIEGFCTIEMVFDADGSPVDYRFLEINPAFEKQTGLHNAAGKLMRDLAPEHEAHWFEIYGKIALTGEPAHFENEAKALGRSYDVYAYRIGGPESRKVAILFNDITERKRAEEKLHRTLEDLERSNRELEEFAYISSHDLQEPLRQIANFSEMLAKEYQERLDERAIRYFGYITIGAKRLQSLINDILSYSRVDQGTIPQVPASLEDILSATLNDLHILIRESGAAISFDPLPAVKVNPRQIGLLLQNLIANSIKFNNGKSPMIHLASKREGGEWVISLRDNGIGFDPQYAEQIFKVFKRMHTQEKYPGTGIGLAICKKIVQRHGGRIWAESQPGRGATFYFTIPA